MAEEEIYGNKFEDFRDGKFVISIWSRAELFEFFKQMQICQDMYFMPKDIQHCLNALNRLLQDKNIPPHNQFIRIKYIVKDGYPYLSYCDPYFQEWITFRERKKRNTLIHQ